MILFVLILHFMKFTKVGKNVTGKKCGNACILDDDVLSEW